MEKSDRDRAVAAARTVVAGLGLPAADADLLSNSDRIVLRLQPADVLARVAPDADHAEAAFEVDVADRLAGTGAPVAGLDPRVPARAYRQDGFVVSLWTYHQPMSSPAVSPDEYADVLRRHHAALRRIDLPAPHLSDRVAAALREVTDVRRSPELPAADRSFLRETLTAALTLDRSGDQLLHGEPHPGNLLATAQGPLLIDLATCCRGPVEFDLAHAPEEADRHYPEAGPALLRRCRALNWALFSAWRWRDADQLPDRAQWRIEGLRRVRAFSRSDSAR